MNSCGMDSTVPTLRRTSKTNEHQAPRKFFHGSVYSGLLSPRIALDAYSAPSPCAELCGIASDVPRELRGRVLAVRRGWSFRRMLHEVDELSRPPGGARTGDLPGQRLDGAASQESLSGSEGLTGCHRSVPGAGRTQAAMVTSPAGSSHGSAPPMASRCAAVMMPPSSPAASSLLALTVSPRQRWAGGSGSRHRRGERKASRGIAVGIRAGRRKAHVHRASAVRRVNAKGIGPSGQPLEGRASGTRGLECRKSSPSVPAHTAL